MNGVAHSCGWVASVAKTVFDCVKTLHLKINLVVWLSVSSMLVRDSTGFIWFHLLASRKSFVFSAMRPSKCVVFSREGGWAWGIPDEIRRLGGRLGGRPLVGSPDYARNSIYRRRTSAFGFRHVGCCYHSAIQVFNAKPVQKAQNFRLRRSLATC